MKLAATLSLILALFTSSAAFAQSGDMQKGMDMKGMDMKGMDMKEMDMKQPAKDVKTITHKAVAVVKKVDVANGKVTLAHEAIKSLNWPPMTMSFAVKDKTLFDKLIVDKKVNVEMNKKGSNYVVIAVK